MNKESTIKIILGILLLLCVFPMPYGFFQLVRFVSMVGFSYLAFQAYKGKNELMVFTFAGLALLFQPFLKIALGREIWLILDLLIGFWLLFSVWKNRNTK